MKKFVFLFHSMLPCENIKSQAQASKLGYACSVLWRGELPFLIVMDRFHMTMLVSQNNKKASHWCTKDKREKGRETTAFVLL